MNRLKILNSKLYLSQREQERMVMIALKTVLTRQILDKVKILARKLTLGNLDDAFLFWG